MNPPSPPRLPPLSVGLVRGPLLQGERSAGLSWTVVAGQPRPSIGGLVHVVQSDPLQLAGALLYVLLVAMQYVLMP